MKKVFLAIGLLFIVVFCLFSIRKQKNIVGKQEFISPFGKDLRLNTLGTQIAGERKTVYGYLPYWTIDEVDNFDLDALTDIAYFGLHIDENGNFIKTQQTDEGTIQNPGYDNWHNNEKLSNFIKEAQNRNVSVALTIISHIDKNSTEFLYCKECWDNFYGNLKTEMDLHNIQDVNLNFEYYKTVDKEVSLKYSEFTKFVKRELSKDFESPQIVVTTFADSLINNRVSDVPSLAKIADKLFIMAYDFHISQNDKAAPVSPMGGAKFYAGYDVRTMIKDYLSYVPPQKLILGVPYYGFNWEEADEETLAEREKLLEEMERKREGGVAEEGTEEHEEGETDRGSDTIVNLPRNNNTVTQTYSDIMEIIETRKEEGKGGMLSWDELAQVPVYRYFSDETGKERTVYFENQKSLEVKYELTKEFDLAGVGIWALGYDGNRPELWQLLKKEF